MGDKLEFNTTCDFCREHRYFVRVEEITWVNYCRFCGLLGNPANKQEMLSNGKKDILKMEWWSNRRVTWFSRTKHV